MATSSEDDERSNTSASDTDGDDFEPQSKKVKIDDWENNYYDHQQSSYNNDQEQLRDSFDEDDEDNEENDDNPYTSDIDQGSFNNELNEKKNEEKEMKFNYTGKGLRLMQQMGYAGGGLGKRGEGIVEPVAASVQEGRRGFGLKLEGLDTAATKWDPKLEKIDIPEKMYWLKNETNDLDQLSLDDLAQLLILGDKKKTIDDETKFCDPEILANILSSKVFLIN